MGQNACASASVRPMFAATSSFLSALIFWRRISIFIVPLSWAVAGVASATATTTRMIRSNVIGDSPFGVWVAKVLDTVSSGMIRSPHLALPRMLDEDAPDLLDGMRVGLDGVRGLHHLLGGDRLHASVSKVRLQGKGSHTLRSRHE